MAIVDTALQYLKQNLCVVPTRLDTKIPFIPWTEWQTKLPDESQVRQWFEKDFPSANVGFVTGLISGICVIDIDSYEGKKEVNALVPESLIFPIAESPRGGEHWYFRCTNADLKTTTDVPGFTKVDVRANGGFIVSPPSMGANGKPYRWRLDILDTPVPTMPKQLYDLLPKKTKTPTEKIDQSVHTDMFNDGTRDKDLFYTACTLFRGRMAHDQVYQVLIKLCMACIPPMELKTAEQKVMSAMKSAVDQPRDLKSEVSQWCIVQDGAFRVDSCFRELDIMTKEQKSEAKKTLGELKVKGIIESLSGIGVYRQVNKNIEFIEIPDNEHPPVGLLLPLGLNELVEIRQRNIIVIAGTGNSGKTAFCLNIAMKNMDNHKIRYQSSEMTGDELFIKLKHLPRKLSEFREKVEWVNRFEKWEDIVIPDAVNIIDFLEIYDKFYEVGAWIKKIHDRLTTGIAIIAIQKKDNKTDTGRGGAFTKEKARLCLSMDYGKVTISKAKHWASSSDPNGKFIGFELEKGVIFKPVGVWDKDPR